MKIDIRLLDSDLQFIANEMAEQLGFAFSADGIPLTAEKRSGNSLSVCFDKKRFVICYGATHQFARGLRLIKQHYKQKSKPFDVAESCAVRELGMLLCNSCNAVRTVDHYKQIIRNLALLGYNQVYVSTDNTFEVPNEPFVGYMRGRYTIRELIEIDEYAARFGIEAIHCFQTLAHQLQLLRWPAYGGITDMFDVLLAEDERTYALIDNMFAALAKSFKSRKIHIGMDEAVYLGKGKYGEIHGYGQKRSEILLKHLRRVIEIAEKYGYEPIMWGDTFYRLLSEDYRLCDDGEIPDTVRDKIPENIRLVYWDYYSKDYLRYYNKIKAYQGFGRDLIFAGGAWIWTGFTPRNRFSFDTSLPSIQACLDTNVQSYMMTLWNDDGADGSDMAALPTVCLASERFYGHDEHIEDAFFSLTGVALSDFMLLDLPCDIAESAPSDKSNRSKYMLYNDCLYGLFDYVPAEGDGEKYVVYAQRIREAAKRAGRYKYLFDTQSALCDVLAIKYELGIKTHKAYRISREAVGALVKDCYRPLLKRLRKFYETFKNQWDRENKPIGFEIQDYRLGGLIQRIEHCAERLTQYAEGKIDALPELREELLVCNESLLNGGMFYDFRGMISANPL